MRTGMQSTGTNLTWNPSSLPFSSQMLNPSSVQEARRKELEFVRDDGVSTKVPAEQAHGKRKIGVEWVDVDK